MAEKKIESAFNEAMDLVKLTREHIQELSDKHKQLQKTTNKLIEGLLGAIDHYMPERKVDSKVILELVQVWINENKSV